MDSNNSIRTGYTGIGVTGQDVIIGGNLYVSGVIDPTALILSENGFTTTYKLDISGNSVLEAPNGAIILDPSTTINALNDMDLNNQNIINGNQITATTFSGALSGNATTATNANNVATTSDVTNATRYIAFKSATSGNLPDLTDTDLTYNPSTNVMAFTALPTCSAVPSLSTQLVNKSYVDTNFALNTILNTNNGGINLGINTWGNVYDFGYLAAGTYILSLFGHWNYSVSLPTTISIRVYNNTTSAALNPYDWVVTLATTGSFFPIGVSHIIKIDSLSSISYQGNASTSSGTGTVLVYVDAMYQKIA